MFCLIIVFKEVLGWCSKKVNNDLIKHNIVWALPFTVLKRNQMETKYLSLIG